MRRLALVGLLLALPLVVVPLVWAAASGGSGDESLQRFRDVQRLAPVERRPLVEAVTATRTRVSMRVTRAVGVEVVVVDRRGTLARRLGHFTVAGGKKLILTWDGRGVPAGSTVVVRANGEVFRAPVRLRRWARADDADRQSLGQPGLA
jgi:hypothetical protein